MELVKKLRIENELGLHARAAAKIVALAGQYKASLFLKKEDQEVEGSSILSILTLACPRGTQLVARATGEDSQMLLSALSSLFEQKFGEGK
jgi:phosphocarrier protein HPr